MRVVLDTNTYISAVVLESPAMKPVYELATIVGEVLLPPYIKDELVEVVVRKFPHRVRTLLHFIDESYYPGIEGVPPDFVLPENPLRDPKDRPILAFVLYKEIDVLVTGDKDFHELSFPGLRK